jgi:hypothetical protein
MNKPTYKVVIPIYKEPESNTELLTLDNCFKIFQASSIIFIMPKGITLTNFFLEKYKPNTTIFFESHYFKNISGYNKLLLTQHFYLSFQNYDYILIYQLDAFVFKNDLDFWCSKKYSYIGAPWFENFDTLGENTQLWAAGNGGLSLRKISDFLNVFNYKGAIFSFRFLWDKYHKYSSLSKFIRLPKLVYHYLFKNNTSNLFDLFGENEDHFWSFHAPRISNNFKIAPVNEALKFAFECNPKKMYELNKQQLPFGVHAWEKYDKAFWDPFIR